MVDVLLKLDHYVLCLTLCFSPVSRSVLKTIEFTMNLLKFYINSGEVEIDEREEAAWRGLIEFLRLKKERGSKYKTPNIPSTSAHNLPLIIL